MSVLFEEMTRGQILAIAPDAIAVLPTSATEQHGPHMAVGTDTLLCTTIARRAAEAAADQVPIVIAPPVAFGSSFHHNPFGGVLTLTSATFIEVVSEVVAGLSRSGFRKVVIINGHGGNSDQVGVVGQEAVNRLGLPIVAASCSYWNLCRTALVVSNLIPAAYIPGHAGQFETSMVMALRPDWVDEAERQQVDDVSSANIGLDIDLTGAVVQSHGTWQNGPGHTDNPAAATAELGVAMLEIIVAEVARFFREFSKVPGPQSER
jgi:creatinine amidohydrolase